MSASGVGRVIERECFYFGSTPLHWRKRLEGKMETSQAAASAAVLVAPVIAQDQIAAPRRLWHKATLTMSFIVHGMAAAFLLIMLWEASHISQRAAASVSQGQLLQSTDSSFSSVDE